MKINLIGKTILTGEEWSMSNIYYVDIYKKAGSFYAKRKIYVNSYTGIREKTIRNHRIVPAIIWRYKTVPKPTFKIIRQTIIQAKIQ